VSFNYTQGQVMKQWIKNFLNQYNDNNTFKLLPLPEGNIPFQANWILNECQAPWLEIIGINAPYAEMYSEAQALRDMFVFHRGEEAGMKGWRSLAVHGISATLTNVPQTYGLDPNKVKYDWTEIQDQCPVTVKFFKEVFPYNQYQRLRYMLLEPGGYIAPHSDNVNNMPGAAVNISLNNPKGCRLTNVHGTLPFRDSGSMFLFNNHYQHAVYNDSDTDRFHMIVHGQWRNPEWNNLIVKSYVNALETQDSLTVEAV
jgi:hypothetical protein